MFREKLVEVERMEKINKEEKEEEMGKRRIEK